jgi:hypothetical protein
VNKNVVIKCLGADRPAMERAIQPGQTAEEILRDCDLEGFWLSLPNRSGFFSPDENVYKAVEDGSVLLASAPMDVATV